MHRNCIIGSVTGASIFGLYATYNYQYVRSLKDEIKHLKGELYDAKRSLWEIQNKEIPGTAINTYDSYDLTDEKNKQFEQPAPKLVASELPPLNAISEDEDETNSTTQTAPPPSPSEQGSNPESAVVLYYKPKSCTYQNTRNIMIAVALEAFMVGSAVIFYLYTVKSNNNCQ